MLGTVIMRMKRTAVCFKFQSQFRLITSEIGKAELMYKASVQQREKITPCLTFKKVCKAHAAYSSRYPLSAW